MDTRGDGGGIRGNTYVECNKRVSNCERKCSVDSETLYEGNDKNKRRRKRRKRRTTANEGIYRRIRCQKTG